MPRLYPNHFTKLIVNVTWSLEAPKNHNPLFTLVSAEVCFCRKQLCYKLREFHSICAESFACSCHCISDSHKKKQVWKPRSDWVGGDSSELAIFWHIGSNFLYQPGCPASTCGKFSLSAYSRERIEPMVLFILTQKACSRDLSSSVLCRTTRQCTFF